MWFISAKKSVDAEMAGSALRILDVCSLEDRLCLFLEGLPHLEREQVHSEGRELLDVCLHSVIIYQTFPHIV